MMLIFDGTNFCRRIYEGCPHKADIPKIFEASLVRALKDSGYPQERFVIFDESKLNWRHSIYPQYKANRKETPPEFAALLATFKEIFATHHVTHLSSENKEADDVVAELALLANSPVRIYSTDKDFLQLVSESITVINHFARIEYTPEQVFKKYGVTPAQMVDWLALVGDSADNIEGIPKVGDKTATALLQKWGSVQNILRNLDAIPGLIGKNIAENAKNLLLAQQLIRLVIR